MDGHQGYEITLEQRGKHSWTATVVQWGVIGFLLSVRFDAMTASRARKKAEGYVRAQLVLAPPTTYLIPATTNDGEIR